MTKTEIAKRVVSGLVMFSTASVVKQVIQNSTSATTISERIAVIIAGHVLGAIAADASKVWTDDKIDELIAWWTKNVTEKSQVSV